MWFSIACFDDSVSDIFSRMFVRSELENSCPLGWPFVLIVFFICIFFYLYFILVFRVVLVWFGLMLNVPVNNFSVMLGRSHRFLGITSTFFGGGVNMSCSRTQHGDPGGARTPDRWIRSPRC